MFLTMYVTMFVAALRLRYTQPNKPRPFRIPGGNYGMWVVGVVGLAGVGVAGALSFAPPNQISTGSPVIYVGILMALTAARNRHSLHHLCIPQAILEGAGFGFRAVRLAD